MVDKGSSGLQQTHWDTCWTEPTHHRCAMRRIAELEKEVEHWKANHKDEKRKKRNVSSMLSVKHKELAGCQEALWSKRKQCDMFEQAVVGLQADKSFLCSEWLKCLNAMNEARANEGVLTKAVDDLIEERDAYDEDLDQCRQLLQDCKDFLDRPEQTSRRAWVLIGQLEEVINKDVRDG